MKLTDFSATLLIGKAGLGGEGEVSSPPIDGAANAKLIRLISKTLEVSKSSVSIISGETSKTKRLRVTGANAQKLRDVLAG